ncbi:ribonuclease H-like domain-containing protein [Tanacetum coccineum]|uniref:Ribonuclease H-like domain-containing protein n=1 Tax=Tanacetum coccineum TaxID=301880 RepID=A0ABQ5EC81_9ASTR
MVKTGLVEAIDSLVPLDEHLATFRGNGYHTKGQKESQKRQNQARNGKDKVKSKPKSVKVKKSTGKSTPTKSKVIQVEKIQREGLKLPNLKLYYKNKKTRAEIANWIRFRIFNSGLPSRVFIIVALELSKGANSLQAEDHNLWDVIVNGDIEEELAPTRETFAPHAPKSAKQLAARRNQERVKSILLLAIPDEYLLKFHNVADAKSLREPIKSRFGGNVESKKMQKNILKHQFEIFSTASNENLDKAYNRNKPDIDEIDIDDLYNNLRVYEDEMKSTASRDFGVSTAGGINQVPSTPCAHDVAYSFFAQPTTSPQLENEDFQQMDGDDLEELDLRWQVAMLTVRVKKFIQRTGRNLNFKEKQHVSLDKTKIECYNYQRKGHFARECRSGRNQRRRSYGDNGRSNAPTNESSSHALVAQDGLGGYDWSNDFEIEPVNYALMVISSSSSSSSSDNELKDKIAKWEESSKNLDEILNSQMSARDKFSLGYGTQLNELSRNHETDSENSLSIFDVRSSDEENTPENDRFSKNRYKVVPPPITENFLTPRADISFAGLDEYAIRNKIIESQTTELNTKTSETAGQTNDANTEKPKSTSKSVVSNPKIDRDRVIIEDWNSDDEEEVNEVQTVRLETQTVKTRDDKSGQNSQKQGINFRKVNAYFVCKSTKHLIKDCNFHDKKSQDPKLKNVVNTVKGWQTQ